MNRKEYWFMLVLAIVAGFMGGVSSLIFTGQPVFAQKTPQLAKVVQSDKFELMDNKGNVRASLGFDSDADGRPALSFFDESGKKVIVLGFLPTQKITPKIPMDTLKELPPDARRMVEASEGGGIGLIVVDTNYVSSISAKIDAGGFPRLSLWEDAEPGSIPARLELGAGPLEGPSLKFFDKELQGPLLKILEDPKSGNIENEKLMEALMRRAEPRAYIGLAADGNPSISVSDENSKRRAVLGSTELEITRTGSVEKRPVSSLVLLDKDGKVIWSAP